MTITINLEKAKRIKRQQIENLYGELQTVLLRKIDEKSKSEPNRLMQQLANVVNNQSIDNAADIAVLKSAGAGQITEARKYLKNNTII